MIPARRFVLLLSGLVVLALLLAFVPTLRSVWNGAIILALIVFAVDLFNGWRQAAPAMERRVNASLALNEKTDVSLRFEKGGGRELTVAVFDYAPDSFKTDELPVQALLPADRGAELSYTVRPLMRGPQLFAGTELRVLSPLGFWWKRQRTSIETRVRVYPDYARVTKLLLQGVNNPLATNGFHLHRRRGEGTEFHQLRDYRDGDSLRALDWKATSRMGRMVSREYRDERDQHVVFVLDTGRRMMTKDADLSHFDHSLNALLLLSYIAARQGDSISILAPGHANSWMPAQKGPSAINAVLNYVYNIEPRPVETDYLAAATDLSVRQRRRSLVVFLTNIRDDAADDLKQAVTLLRRRHLVMLASLRELVLDERAAGSADNLADALGVAATHQYLASRTDAHDKLRAGGVVVEDCLARELPAAIVNRYLEVKRAGML